MSVITQSKAGFPQPGLDAAREGRAIRGYVNAKTGLDSEVVLTDSTLLKVIPIDERLIITNYYMYLSTVSDWVTVEFVVTENEDGSGAITALSPKFRIDTGASVAASVTNQVTIWPTPICVTRAMGHAFSVQVLANDAAAALTFGFNGWTENDVGTN